MEETFFACKEKFYGRPTEFSHAAIKASYDLLDGAGISYWRAEHDPAATIALCHRVEQVLGAKIPKNLLLCNRSRSEFYLLLLGGDKPLRTKYLSAQLGCSRLSFAPEDTMQELLGVQPGSAGVPALMNDREKRVKLVIDRSVLQEEWFACHPCRNTQTVAFTTEELIEKLLPALGRVPVIVDLPEVCND